MDQSAARSTERRGQKPCDTELRGARPGVRQPPAPVGRLGSWGPTCPPNAEVTTASGPLRRAGRGRPGPVPTRHLAAAPRSWSMKDAAFLKSAHRKDGHVGVWVDSECQAVRLVGVSLPKPVPSRLKLKTLWGEMNTQGAQD